MTIVRYLTRKRWMHRGMDAYQAIESQATPNQRARLLLKFIRSRSSECFWSFQEALAKGGYADFAFTRENEQAVVNSFSVEELEAAYYSVWQKGRPAAVVKVNQKLKESYRSMQMPSLTGATGRRRVSLDELRVNVCLLSTDKLSASRGGAERGESSPIGLEDMFKTDKRHRSVTYGHVGSGKSAAFMEKAPFEWAKIDRHCPFWENITLFFKGSLTKRNWWKARQLAEVFGLSKYGLTKKEEADVVKYINSHSEQVLLVADSLDKARVVEDSLLWKILTGECRDLPRLKLIVCSRPCARARWLSEHGQFNQCLQVIGFTDEKIGQFIDAFFALSPRKAHELKSQLSGRSDAKELMHTPLLATLICRLFQFDMALPCTQTGVFQSSVLAMLQQSAKQAKKKAPKNIFDELSPPHLQATMQNLCKLAYNGLKSTQAVFTESQLSSAKCLGAAAELGFLSLSDARTLVDQDEDWYAFQHDTMQEFLAAVHIIRECTRPAADKSIGDFVEELGEDGDKVQLWKFVGGLLPREQHEALLDVLAVKAADINHDPPELSRLLLLLFHCHSEGVPQRLGGEASSAVVKVMESIGLDLTQTHLSVRDARVVADVLDHYGSSLDTVNFFSTTMDKNALSTIIAGLQNCTKLRFLNPGPTGNTDDSKGVARVIEQNKSSLRYLVVPACDEDLPLFVPSIAQCTDLITLVIGSQTLTNASAPTIAEILQHQRDLFLFGLAGRIDDDGFMPIASSLLDTTPQLKRLALNWTRLTLPVLINMLASLPYLDYFQLAGNPIGDDGFANVAATVRQLKNLKDFQVFDANLTCESLAEMDRLLHDMPTLSDSILLCEKRSFLPSGQDIGSVTESLTSVKLTEWRKLKKPTPLLGYSVTDELEFVNDRSQEFSLHFFS